MANTHFVLIHGLAAKPKRDVLAQRYRKYLGESIGQAIAPERAHLAYWADLMGYELLTPQEDEYSDNGQHFRPYSLWEQFTGGARGVARGAVVELVESRFSETLADPAQHRRGLDSLVAGLPGLLADNPARRLYERFLPDLHRYFFSGQREPVRERLREQLNAAPGDAPVCLIAHSMGSIIALDVIIAGSRRIETLITIGSPLGLEVVKEQIGVNEAVKQGLSSKIDHWFNLYDRLDVVALDSDLADDFVPMPVHDVRVRNEFVNKEDERNYHKSYGYLRSPEMGEIVRELI